jgi:hypothetical protein
MLAVWPVFVVMLPMLAYLVVAAGHQELLFHYL